jgi:uncharacterized RDD family membrane protein YckC
MEKNFHVDQLAKPSLRLMNFIIDSSIIAVVYSFLNSNNQMTNESGLSRTNILALIIIVTYYTLSEWLLGKTLGKFLTKTTVINDNGTQLNFGMALLRSIIRLIPLVQWTYVGKVSYGWPDRFTNTIVVPDIELKNEN